jgi:hypothetical protein
MTATALIVYFVALLVMAYHFPPQIGVLIAIVANKLILRLATLVHELGHALIGQACGGRLIAVAVRPLELRFHPIAFHRARPSRWGKGGGDGGGYTICKFRPSRHGRRYLLYIYGGVIGNAAGALLAIAATWLFALPDSAHGPLDAFALWSGWQAGANLLAYPGSDGARIALVRRSAALRARIMAYHRSRPPRPRGPWQLAGPGDQPQLEPAAHLA